MFPILGHFVVNWNQHTTTSWLVCSVDAQGIFIQSYNLTTWKFYFVEIVFFFLNIIFFIRKLFIFRNFFFLTNLFISLQTFFVTKLFNTFLHVISHCFMPLFVQFFMQFHATFRANFHNFISFLLNELKLPSTFHNFISFKWFNTLFSFPNLKFNVSSKSFNKI